MSHRCCRRRDGQRCAKRRREKIKKKKKKLVSERFSQYVFHVFQENSFQTNFICGYSGKLISKGIL